MKIRTVSESEIKELNIARVRKEIPLDDPRRHITRGVDMDSFDGVRLRFSSNEDMVSYFKALHDEEDSLIKEVQ
jgi:hypothetical protein